jgi:hypothetical protein
MMAPYIIQMRVCSLLLVLSAASAYRLGAYRLSSVRHVRLSSAKLPETSTEVRNNVSEQFLGNDNEEFVDAALVRRIEQEVMEISGVGLDGLMNPSTVLNLERDLLSLNAQLESETDSSRKTELINKINKKSDKLFVEKRTVMRGWLKSLFVGQSVLAGVVSLGMVYNAIPGQDLPLSLQVLGFWMWWLFIIPSLRARKPGSAEKEALNIAFLATPIVSLVMPTFTKDTGLLWWGNAGAVAICYAYSFLKFPDGVQAADEEEDSKSPVPLVIRRVINALDYGSGRERGARK